MNGKKEFDLMHTLNTLYYVGKEGINVLLMEYCISSFEQLERRVMKVMFSLLTIPEKDITLEMAENNPQVLLTPEFLNIVSSISEFFTFTTISMTHTMINQNLKLPDYNKYMTSHYPSRTKENIQKYYIRSCIFAASGDVFEKLIKIREEQNEQKKLARPKYIYRKRAI